MRCIMNNALRDIKQEAMDGSPSAIRDVAGFINIKFQCGTIPEVGVNGTSIENVINLLIDRLTGFQSGPFRCRENALAITKLQEAVMWLEFRTQRRVRQGIEGTHNEVAEGDTSKGDQNRPVK